MLLVGWDIAGIYLAIKNLGFTIESFSIALLMTVVLGWLLIYVT